MSTMPIRTSAKPGPRPLELQPDGQSLDASTYLSRAVALHLTGKSEEALRTLQRAAAAGESSAEICLAMGHLEFELGRFAEAEKSYRTLVKLKPQYVTGWFNLAVALERLGTWKDAAECFERVSTLDSAQAEAFLGAGICQLRLDDGPAAVAAFERCLAIAPGNEDAHFGKAVALQIQNHVEEASRIYQEILKRNPECEEALSNLILIGVSKADFDAVRECAERLLELRPESTVALEALAAWAADSGEHALTAKFCTLLTSAVPGHFEGWFNLGLSYQKTARWEQAAEAYREALALRPQSAEVYTNLGIVREQLGDTASAKEAYQQAIRADRDALSALWNLALLFEQTGELQQAEQTYRALLQKSPKEPETLFRLGFVRLELEDYKAAVESFECCVKNRPQWVEAQANLALAYARMGNRDRAQQLYEDLLEYDPKSLEALRGLAAMALRASDWESSLEYHVRMIDLGERSPDILYNTALLYEKSGQPDKAAAFYRETLAQQPDMSEALLNLGRVLQQLGQDAEAGKCFTRALDGHPTLARGYFGPPTD